MATDVTVLGAGNTGFAVAANLTLAGHSVTLGELPAFPRATDRVHAALTPFFLDIVPLPDVFGCGLRAVNPSRIHRACCSTPDPSDPHLPDDPVPKMMLLEP